MENSINNLINLNNSYKALLKELEAYSEVISVSEAIDLFVDSNILKLKITPYRFLKKILKSKFFELYEEYKCYIPVSVIRNYAEDKLYILFKDYLNLLKKDLEIIYNNENYYPAREIACKLLSLLGVRCSYDSSTKLLIDDLLCKGLSYIEEFILVFNEGYLDKVFDFLYFCRFLMVKVLEQQNIFKGSYPFRDPLFIPDIARKIKQIPDFQDKPMSRDKISNLIHFLGVQVYNIPRIDRNFNPDSNIDLLSWCQFAPCVKKEDFKKISNFLKTYSSEEIRKMILHKSIDEIASSKYNGDTASYYRDIATKTKNTVIQRYGGYDFIAEKARQSNMVKYGTDNINNLEWKKEKTKETVLKRYGVPHISQSSEFKKKVKNTYIQAQQEDILVLQESYKKTFYDFKSLARKFEYKNPSDVRTIARKIGITIYKTPHGSYLDEDGVKELESHLSSFMSSGEFFISKFLEENHIKYFYNKRFENCKDTHVLPFDFYLPDYNLCIEYQGKQHFEDIPFLSCKQTKLKPMKNPSSLEDRQRKDNIKRNFCRENNIKLIEPAYYHTHDEIKKMILEAIVL